MHELARGSNRRRAATDVAMTVPLGRSCHEWVTTHPAAAVDEGWAVWGWQFRQMMLTAVDTGMHRDTLHPMTIQKAIRFDEQQAERIQQIADEQGRTFTQQVQYFCKRGIRDYEYDVEVNARSNSGPMDGTIERPEPPTTWSSSTPVQRPRVNPVTGLPYGPTPKGK